MEREEMITELEAYLNHITFAQDCFVAYKSLLDALAPYNKQINLAPGFFTISMYALSKCLCIELAKLFCGSGKERTIRKLIHLIRANANLFPKHLTTCYQWVDEPDRPPYEESFPVRIIEEINIADEKLNKLAPIISRLKERRDKFLAHNDPLYFDGKRNPTSDFPISFDDVRELIDFADQFCNKMLAYLDRRVIACRSTNADDLTQLLQKVI